jgi:glycerol-3-phosphate dehydrogenase (NAD(P)+)
MPKAINIAVLGSGSWGLTLGLLLAENDHSVTMWEFDERLAGELRSTRESPRFLPGIKVPERIPIETDLASALRGADMILFAVPSHAVRSTAKAVGGVFDFTSDTLVVNAAKGFEEKTLKRMSEVLKDELPVDPERILTLAGPSHAEEVSRRMPTSVVAAGIDRDNAQRVQEIFFRPYFRVYTNPDLIGVETAVSIKNVISIAAGACDGLGYGDNTKAALLTRGMVEITRLGVALGARRETFFGLAGIGDLIVTALSRHSRNRHVGQKIGEGQTLEQILSEMVMVAEGVRTTRAASELAQTLGVEMPITSAVHAVLFDGADPRKAINHLMNRPPQDEMRWMDSSQTKGGRS